MKPSCRNLRRASRRFRLAVRRLERAAAVTSVLGRLRRVQGAIDAAEIGLASLYAEFSRLTGEVLKGKQG
jgi:hypothetical protein